MRGWIPGERLAGPALDRSAAAVTGRVPADGGRAPGDGAPLTDRAPGRGGAPGDGAPLDQAPGDGAPLDQPPGDEAPVIGVLALQGDVLEHLRALERSGAHPVRVRRPADLDGLDGLVLPGGESTTIGRLLERGGLLEPLRARLREGLPALGTCAGLILLSRELAGDHPPQALLGVLDVVTRRNAFGRQAQSFEAELAVDGIDGGPLRVAFIRAPWIEHVGAGIEVLARVGGHPVLVAQGVLLGAAFHPEVTGDDRLHRQFVGLARRGRPVPAG